MRNPATTGDVMPDSQVAGTGCERSPCSPGNGYLAPTGGAKSVALSLHSINAHVAELAEVIDAWPDLPAALQHGILAMVRAARGG